MMFARIGIMRALNRHVERVLDSSPKKMHWEKRGRAFSSLSRTRRPVAVDKAC